jgi:hypothetical protein
VCERAVVTAAVAAAMAGEFLSATLKNAQMRSGRFL